MGLSEEPFFLFSCARTSRESHRQYRAYKRDSKAGRSRPCTVLLIFCLFTTTIPESYSTLQRRLRKSNVSKRIPSTFHIHFPQSKKRKRRNRSQKKKKTGRGEKKKKKKKKKK